MEEVVKSDQHLRAIFRSFRDARDARRSLLESGFLPYPMQLFLFPLAHSADRGSDLLQGHESDRAEYAGHGEQIAIFHENWYSVPSSECSVRSTAPRDGHTLLVVMSPPSPTVQRICDRLKDYGAFAICPPASRWRLCNSS